MDDQAPESEDHFEVSEAQEDTLKVRISMPSPMDHEVIARRLVESAVVGGQGSVLRGQKTFKMEHADSGYIALGRKSSHASPWTLRIIEPDGEEKEIDARTNINWIGDQKGLRIAASQLASRIIEPANMLREVRESKPSEGDVLRVEVGQTDRVIGSENKAAGNEMQGRMIVEAEIPMPREFQDYTDQYNDGARRDRVNDIIIVGDFVSGEIVAEKQKNGRWLAVGQGDLDYERKFGARHDLNQDDDLDRVAVQIAEDMASLQLSDKAILDHARREASNPEFVTSVILDGQEYPIDDEPGVS